MLLTTQDWDETRHILNGLSPQVQRVHVLRDDGSQKWVAPADVEDTDLLIFKPDGITPMVMLNVPGRPANPQAVSAATAQNVTAKSQSVSRDHLVRLATNDPEDPGVLDSVIRGLAEESASLKWEREAAETRGDDTSQYSVRRGRLLTSIGDQWLKRREVSSTRMIDLDGPAFKALFSFMVGTFRDAMLDAGTRQEMVDRTVAKFGAKMGPEWEKAARDAMVQGLAKANP